MTEKDHWNNIYNNKADNEVSWYQPHAEFSLRLINSLQLPKSASIIDVGGGSSSFIDDLINHEYKDLTVMDISYEALETAKTRLHEKASKVNWIEADLLTYNFARPKYNVWHDRSVFHFLTHKQERVEYIKQVTRAVLPGGYVIVATFADDGPKQCSGLPVKRYAIDKLVAEFGDSFSLLTSLKETHETPEGHEQKFVYCLCKLGG